MKTVNEGLNEKHGITLKLLVVMFVVLLLLIPKVFVEDLVREREGRKCEAYGEIANGWGSDQSVNGVILYVPVVYERTIEKKKETKTLGEVETETEKEMIRTVKYLHILPDRLNTTGKMIPERRYKSIYDFIFFTSDIDVSGSFILKNMQDYSAGEGSIKWNEAFIVMGISSMNGIKENVKMDFNGSVISLEQGVINNDVFNTGLNSKVKIEYMEGKTLNFSYNLKLNGSGSFMFLPSGKETQVHLESTWAHPNFHGGFIPADKQISDSGFISDWKVIDLNRNYPQNWIEGEFKNTLNESLFGVSLAYPVDDYRKISRSVKYLVLFVSLTFLMFFLSEVLSKKRIHFVQYVLVGLSLIVFFVLLLSLSEHISFLISYIISSISTIALIGLYSTGILKSSKLAFLISGALTVLYIFLYILLQNQDYSLLFGSFGLFAALFIVMMATRTTDWYSLNQTNEGCKKE